MPYITPDTIPVATRSRDLLIPDDIYILAAVNGALYDLTLPENWEKVGAISPDEIAARMLEMFEAYLTS